MIRIDLFGNPFNVSSCYTNDLPEVKKKREKRRLRSSLVNYVKVAVIPPVVVSIITVKVCEAVS